MKKTIYLPTAFLVLALLSQQCSPPQTQEQLTQIKKNAIDSAKSILLDSVASRSKSAAATYKEKQIKVFKPEEIFHSPPDDGHVHDGGFGITGMVASQEYVSGIMDRVIDQDHNVVAARIPFIVKKGLIKPGDDYLSDKKNHAHLIEYDLVDVPLIDPVTGQATGETIVIAIVKKVRPKN